MSQSNLLGPLVEAIETVKQRIADYSDSLAANETRTRVALIDPILQALGWDVSDPKMVTPEFPVGAGRADYALLNPKGKAVVALEAKKLGESLTPHRQQMVNYSNTAGIGYAGLTDGQNWEVYKVFTANPLPLTERLMLSINISEAPSFESALKLLLLWRTNLESEQPIEAEAPIRLISVDALPDVLTPTPITPNRSPFSQPMENWTPLGEVEPTITTRPRILKLPDGTEQRVGRWSDVIVNLIDWLSKNEKLTHTTIPLKTLNGATIVSSTKLTKDFQQVGSLPIYVNKKGSFGTHVSRWRFIASEFGFNLNSFLVQIR